MIEMKKCRSKRMGYYIHAHHKNENPFDNRLANLELLCARCHKKHHTPVERFFKIRTCFVCEKDFLKRNCEIRKYRSGKLTVSKHHFCSNLCRREWLSGYAWKNIRKLNKTEFYEKYQDVKTGKFTKEVTASQ